MTREEAKTVFLNRGYAEVEGGTIYDADKWRESCRVISEWLEQEPTITSTEDSAKMTYPQVEGITPTVVEPLPDVDKKIESYKKLLKHPVIKSIMGMDETPVTLSVSENPNNCDLISREAVEEIITDIRNCISVEGYWAILERMKKLPSVKPQESKTVLYSGDGYADGYMVYDMAECPNCGYEYEYGDKDWGLPFCPNCSQKLNWERSDKE